MNGYKTLRGPASAELTEKRSVFICRVRPVTTEAQALAFLAEVRKQCADARHNVYAYTIRENGIARFSDDGEPHGTAGLPTLDALRKRGIVDAAAVTTRYFGGVLLGTGGAGARLFAGGGDGRRAGGRRGDGRVRVFLLHRRLRRLSARAGAGRPFAGAAD